MSGGGIPVISPLAKAVEGVAKGVGSTVENIGRNPIPAIMAIGITVATSGLGAGVAAAQLAGFTAAEIAVAGSMGSIISAATNAAIANAAIAAVNGGDISKIATAGIIGGLSAGITAGIPVADVVRNVTEGLDPSTVQIIQNAAGRSVGNAVSAVLQGRDPFTGALSGAVSGALSTAFTNGQIAELSKTAGNIIGNVGAAAAVAGVTGKDIEKAIANTAAYGIVNSALSEALNKFQDIKFNYQSNADKINPLIEEANELYKTAEEQRLAAEEKNAEIDPQLEEYKAQYYAAKDAKDVSGMQAAAEKFNELNAQREANLADFNQTNAKLTELKGQIEPLNEILVQQQAELVDAGDALEAAYGNFSETATELTERQAAINESANRLPTYYKEIYDQAVAKGEDGMAAIAEVKELYEVNKAEAEAQISDLPPEYKAAFQSQLLQGVDPGEAARNVQDLMTRNVAGSFGAQDESQSEKDVVAKVEGVYKQNPNTGMWSVVGKDPEGNEITLVPIAQGAGAPLEEGASAGYYNLSTNPNDPDAYIAEAAPTKYNLNYTTDPNTGEITVTNPDGSKDIYNADGDLVRQTSAEGTTSPFKGINLGMFNVANKTVRTPRPRPPSTGTGTGGTGTGTGTGTGSTGGTGLNLGLLGSALLGAGSSFMDTSTGGGGTGTDTGTTPQPQPQVQRPIEAPDIQHLTPNLIKGSAFQFADEPEFEMTYNPVQPNPQYGYQQPAPITFNAANGGSTSHFMSALNHLATPIQKYADGEQVQMPSSPSPTLRPTLTRGSPLERMRRFRPVQFGQYEQKEYAAGGNVEGHNPQFYSEGGLNSLENTYVKGPGDGTSDSVPAMLADGEFVIPADVVSKLGNGSNDAGASALSQMMQLIREHAQNHDPKKLPPKSKGALAYLLDAKRKVT
jgi:predicted  nucleic acid-binding Zn-ribbon protein